MEKELLIRKIVIFPQSLLLALFVDSKDVSNSVVTFTLPGVADVLMEHLILNGLFVEDIEFSVEDLVNVIKGILLVLLGEGTQVYL